MDITYLIQDIAMVDALLLILESSTIAQKVPGLVPVEVKLMDLLVMQTQECQQWITGQKKSTSPSFLVVGNSSYKMVHSHIQIILPLFLMLTACNNMNSDPMRPAIRDGYTAPDLVAEDWSNPNLIKGSSFGHLLNTAYRLKNYDLLIRLTDSTSRNQFQEKEIIDHYRSFGLGFQMRLLSTAKVANGYTMNYEVKVNATKQILTLPVVVERDTCRVLLNEFKEHIGLLRT